MKWALLAFVGATTMALAATPAQPAYALMGIVQADPRPAGERVGPTIPLAEAAGSTRLLYSTDGEPLRAVRDARGTTPANPPVIVYMGGLTTNPKDDLAALERDFRTGIAMTPAAVLGEGIDASMKTVIAARPTEGELAIKASTADASDAANRSKYCFWIRVDDELMKVVAVDHGARVEVERGFGGSIAAAHGAGARVFSPVYLGNRNQLGNPRHTNSWPGGPDDLRYALDPRSAAAQAVKAARVVGVMRAGFDGAWFDTFQPMPYNLCDALGRKVTYFWDFGANQVYSFDRYLDALKEYVRGVRVATRAATGREPILYANSATTTYARGTKQLFNHGAFHDLLDGYCFEDSYLKVRAEREKGHRVQADYLAITGPKWLENVTNHADAARSGLCGICMSGAAGYLAAYLNPALPEYARLLRFAYGSFLLTVTKERTTELGLPLLVAGAAATPWPALLFAPLGDPLQANEINRLQLEESGCYARRFQHGWVVVNPSASANPAAVPVPAGYRDAESGQPVTTLSLGSGDARILLSAEAP